MKWRESTAAGTMLHSYVEHRVNGVETPPIQLAEPDLEIPQVNQFFQDEEKLGVEWIRTELRLSAVAPRVCGTLDALAKIRGVNGHVIYDWKRSRNVFNPITQQYGRDFTKYQKQLTGYRILLELNGVEVSNRGYLVVFHPIYPTYQKIEVDLDIYYDEVKSIFQEREKMFTL